MRIFIALLLFIFSLSLTAHAVDNERKGRAPNVKMDADIYNDFDILKSGHYYITAHGGINNFDVFKPAKPEIPFNPEFAAGLTFGANFNKYLGTEVVALREDFVYVSPEGISEYIQSYNIAWYLTLRYAFRVNYAFSIIPYVGAGINMALLITPGNSVILPIDERLVNEFNGVMQAFVPSFGFSTKVGLRFKVNYFLAGIGMQYNFSYLDFNMKRPNFFLELGGTF